MEVLVTDRAEWRIQRERVTASSISTISYDLIVLAYILDPAEEVDWGKEQVMSTSNNALALERLQPIIADLYKISAHLSPGLSASTTNHGPSQDLRTPGPRNGPNSSWPAATTVSNTTACAPHA